MKTLKSLLIVAATLVFYTNTITANTAGNGEMMKKIKSALNMPESMKAKHSSKKVTVHFAVNEKGDVNEVCAITNDKSAKKDIETQFMKLNFPGLLPCVKNSVDINFVVY